jgi:hypothetical protein
LNFLQKEKGWSKEKATSIAEGLWCEENGPMILTESEIEFGKRLAEKINKDEI